MAAAAANLLGVAKTPLATYSAEEIGQSELHWGVRRLLQLLAAERPLLVVFEDLHWAEPTLLDLIRSLGEIEEGAPILLIGSARPELKDSSPAMLESNDNRSLLELAPLGEDESRALMAELVGDEAKNAQFEGLLKNAAETRSSSRRPCAWSPTGRPIRSFRLARSPFRTISRR